MSVLTQYGVEVKKSLIEHGMSQKTLAERISEKTGLFVDSGYLYKILTGARSAPKVTAAINEILEIKA